MNHVTERRITLLVDGLWNDLFNRFDADVDINITLAGKLASVGEKAIVKELEEFYGD